MSQQVQPQTATEAPSRFVSVKEFSRRSSLARSSLYRMVERGEISKPCKLTPKRVAWPAEVIDAWFAARAAEQATA